MELQTGHNIFTSDVGNIYTKSGVYVDELWNDSEASHDLNTYRNFNEFTLPLEPIQWPKDPQAPEDSELDNFIFSSKTKKQFTARHSLFNAYQGVANNAPYQLYGNAPLLDSPTTRNLIRSRSDCSVKALVRESSLGHMGRAIYDYSDFMFCTHLGKISNNYLITLRRFPYPPGDHINFSTLGDMQDSNGHMPDIGRLVTWMGTPGNDMNGILKYKVLMPYTERKSEVQEATADSSGGFMAGILGLGSKAHRTEMLNGSNSNSYSLAMTGNILSGIGLKTLGDVVATPPPDTSWAYHHDKNKPYGPVDSISSVWTRSSPDDQGLTFEHSIKLCFDYTLRAYNGINTKAAFLDLLANVLAVCYTDGRFWGGCIRGAGSSQSNIMSNLPIYNMQEPLTLNGIGDAILGTIKGIGAMFNNGNTPNSLGDWLNSAKNAASGLLTATIAGALNKLGRPQKQSLNALLVQQSTGMWHLTIGNPRHPIMMMGNMKLDDVEIEHYGPLGLDDFPTGLRVNITLSHAMPRDKMMIENMYNSGDTRIYFPLGKDAYEIWNNAEEAGGSSTKHATNVKDSANASANQDIAGNPDTPTTQDQKHKQSTTKNRWLKYFGTTEPQAITKAGMEAHMGSQPAKPPVEDGEKYVNELQKAANS